MLNSSEVHFHNGLSSAPNLNRGILSSSNAPLDWLSASTLSNPLTRPLDNKYSIKLLPKQYVDSHEPRLENTN